MQIHCNEGDDYNDEINEHDAVLDDNDDAGQVEDRRRRERENAAGLREAWTGNGRPPMDSQVIVMVVLMMIVGYNHDCDDDGGGGGGGNGHQC